LQPKAENKPALLATPQPLGGPKMDGVSSLPKKPLIEQTPPYQAAYQMNHGTPKLLPQADISSLISSVQKIVGSRSLNSAQAAESEVQPNAVGGWRHERDMAPTGKWFNQRVPSSPQLRNDAGQFVQKGDLPKQYNRDNVQSNRGNEPILQKTESPNAKANVEVTQNRREMAPNQVKRGVGHLLPKEAPSTSHQVNRGVGQLLQMALGGQGASKSSNDNTVKVTASSVANKVTDRNPMGSNEESSKKSLDSKNASNEQKGPLKMYVENSNKDSNPNVHCGEEAPATSHQVTRGVGHLLKLAFGDSRPAAEKTSNPANRSIDSTDKRKGPTAYNEFAKMEPANACENIDRKASKSDDYANKNPVSGYGGNVTEREQRNQGSSIAYDRNKPSSNTYGDDASNAAFAGRNAGDNQREFANMYGRNPIQSSGININDRSANTNSFNYGHNPENGSGNSFSRYQKPENNRPANPNSFNSGNRPEDASESNFSRYHKPKDNRPANPNSFNSGNRSEDAGESNFNRYQKPENNRPTNTNAFNSGNQPQSVNASNFNRYQKEDDNRPANTNSFNSGNRPENASGNDFNRYQKPEDNRPANFNAGNRSVNDIESHFNRYQKPEDNHPANFNSGNRPENATANNFNKYQKPEDNRPANTKSSSSGNHTENVDAGNFNRYQKAQEHSNEAQMRESEIKIDIPIRKSKAPGAVKPQSDRWFSLSAEYEDDDESVTGNVSPSKKMVSKSNVLPGNPNNSVRAEGENYSPSHTFEQDYNKSAIKFKGAQEDDDDIAAFAPPPPVSIYNDVDVGAQPLQRSGNLQMSSNENFHQSHFNYQRTPDKSKLRQGSLDDIALSSANSGVKLDAFNRPVYSSPMTDVKSQVNTEQKPLVDAFNRPLNIPSNTKTVSALKSIQSTKNTSMSSLVDTVLDEKVDDFSRPPPQTSNNPTAVQQPGTVSKPVQQSTPNAVSPMVHGGAMTANNFGQNNANQMQGGINQQGNTINSAEFGSNQGQGNDAAGQNSDHNLPNNWNKNQQGQWNQNPQQWNKNQQFNQNQQPQFNQSQQPQFNQNQQPQFNQNQQPQFNQNQQMQFNQNQQLQSNHNQQQQWNQNQQGGWNQNQQGQWNQNQGQQWNGNQQSQWNPNQQPWNQNQQPWNPNQQSWSGNQQQWNQNQQQWNQNQQANFNQEQQSKWNQNQQVNSNQAQQCNSNQNQIGPNQMQNNANQAQQTTTNQVQQSPVKQSQPVAGATPAQTLTQQPAKSAAQSKVVNPPEELANFSMNEALTILEALSPSLEMLTPALDAIIMVARKRGTDTFDAIQLFTVRENMELVNICLYNFKTSASSADARKKANLEYGYTMGRKLLAYCKWRVKSAAA